MAVQDLVTAENFVKLYMLVFGMYGLQMLFVPAKMVNDHFKNQKVTPMLEFWIRGSSCFVFTALYVVHKYLSLEEAVPVCTYSSLACGILYPWNAKFGWITKGLEIKYPMHYFPEAIMAVLAAMGWYLMKQQEA